MKRLSKKQMIIFSLGQFGWSLLGGIISAWLGDATKECPDVKSMNAMLDNLILDKEIIPHMCDRIDELKKAGLYNGAYECVKLAVKGYGE